MEKINININPECRLKLQKKRVPAAPAAARRGPSGLLDHCPAGLAISGVP